MIKWQSPVYPPSTCSSRSNHFVKTVQLRAGATLMRSTTNCFTDKKMFNELCGLRDRIIAWQEAYLSLFTLAGLDELYSELQLSLNKYISWGWAKPSSVSSLLKTRLRTSIFPHGPLKIEISKKLDPLNVKVIKKSLTSKGWKMIELWPVM